MIPSPSTNPSALNASLRVVFAGTPTFARTALERINNPQLSKHRVVGVLTQPDRPAGRGLKLQESTVKSYASEHNIAVLQPRSLRLDGKYPEDAQQALEQLKRWQPDVLVVAAYGLILPKWTLECAPNGCLNIHASLLPRWRGAAPIHRAIEAGDALTGVCIMQMDEGLDTGGILTQEVCPIQPHDTTDSLHDKLANIGAKLILETLDQIGSLQSEPQALDGVNYAHKIEKLETWVDWYQPAQLIERKLRAFSSLPGLQTHCANQVFKIWSADVPEALQAKESAASEKDSPPGTILKISAQGVDVQCAQGVFRITQLQRAGGKRIAMDSFILGSSLQAGDQFSSGPATSTNP